jgi:thiosulfate dehydrogenase
MADNKIAFPLVIVFIFAVVGGVLSLVLSNFLNFSEYTPVPTQAPASPGGSSRPVYNPPSPREAPEAIREAVLLGYNIMMETPKYLPAYVGNKLKCVSCHFQGGITEGGKGGGLSLVGVGATYPKYRQRQEYAADLVSRTNSCLERSMNGKPLPPDSQEMAAILTYYQWISQGLPIYGDIPWLGLRPLKQTAPPDKVWGAQVFQEKCVACHGSLGEGTKIAPPLWGDESFNDGAGMSHSRTLSAFAFLNMPWGNPDLTEDQAWAVAAWVTSQSRPHFMER